MDNREKLEEAKRLYETANADQKYVLERLFPGLNESEDGTRKEIIKFVKSRLAGFPECDKFIAWLEKQGEQKPNDKVEPKFKVGDWIVYRRNDSSMEIILVYDIRDNRYYFNDNVHFSWSVKECDEKCHLWTIQDAKDGDVLACNEEILLFKSYSVQGRISLYCWYNGQTNNFHSKGVDDTLLTTKYKICPATKEQRDTLEKAMADAGYTFDFKRKELKKVEQKPAENKGMNLVEEEMTPFQKKVFCIIDTTIEEEQGLKQVCDELFALASNEIKQNPAWSEDDELHVNSLLKRLEGLCRKEFAMTRFAINEDEDWLKSLRPQNRWKPSERDLGSLADAIIHYEGIGIKPNGLKELFEQLKKLREE